MSNHTFIYSTDAPDKPLFGECPEDGQLLMAAMSIPVFWYMLFDKKSLKLGPGGEASDTPYMHMTAPTADALARVEARWADVSRVLGRAVEPLFRTWIGFVREHAKAHVHCETAEWFWMFDSHEKFVEELRLCLDAFQHVPKPRGRAVKLNKWWDNVLAQAGVDQVAGDLRPLGNNSYCGFGHNFPVPWSENEEEGCGVLRKELRDAPAVGKGPQDIRGFLDRWGRVSEFRTAKCGCGSEVFRLAYEDFGAQRTCASCGTEHLMCDSEDYWDGTAPKQWKCEGCGGELANLGVGFNVAIDGRLWGLAVGERCGKCGRLDWCIGWETGGGPELFDQV